MMRPSPTRLAGYPIALLKELICGPSLLSTVNSVEYTSFEYTTEDADVVLLVKSEHRRRQIRAFLLAVYPQVYLLRLVDSGTPTMGLIFSACLKVEKALEASRDELDAVFPRDSEPSVHDEIHDAWEEKEHELKHAWAKTGFLTNPELIEEVLGYDDQQDLREAASYVIRKIYHDCDDVDSALCSFFNSLTDFQDKQGGWHDSFIWKDPNLSAGKYHIWHRNYSLPHAKVFGKVGCIVQAQLTGMGAAERNWAHVKYIWDDASANMKPGTVEKKVTVWEAIRREDQLISECILPEELPFHRMWTQDEVDFDLGLEKRGIEIDMLAEKERLFMNSMEDWEAGCIAKKLGINEFKLLQKYGGMRFYDDDEDDVFVICDTNLEWKKKDKTDPSTPCYAVLATPYRNESSTEESDSEEDAVCYHINDVLHDMIAHRSSGHPSDVKLVQ